MFYSFLIEHELVTAEQIVECLDLQSDVTPRVGHIALWSGRLRMSQIWQILEHQADKGGLFGDIAIELGFFDKAARDEIIIEQLERRPRVEELLVERGYVSAEAMRVARQQWNRESMAASRGEAATRA